MKVEGINNVSNSYSGQGSQSSAAVQQTSSSASARQETKRQDSAAAGIASRGFEIQDSQGVREEGQASNEQIRQAVDKINKSTQNEEAVFGIHEGTNRVTIKIVDRKTKEIIKEFPPEKTLDMIAKVWEMAGIMVDERR